MFLCETAWKYQFDIKFGFFFWFRSDWWRTNDALNERITGIICTFFDKSHFLHYFVVSTTDWLLLSLRFFQKYWRTEIPVKLERLMRFYCSQKTFTVFSVCDLFSYGQSLVIGDGFSTSFQWWVTLMAVYTSKGRFPFKIIIWNTIYCIDTKCTLLHYFSFCVFWKMFM